MSLSNEDKAGIINTHIKNLNYTRYNYELGLIEENSKTTANAEGITNLNSLIAEVDKQLAALEKELAKVNPTV